MRATGEPMHAAADPVRVQRRALRVLSSSNLLAAVGMGGAVPAGPLLAFALTHSAASAGLAQALVNVGGALFALPLARIALAHGRRPSLTTGLALGALGATAAVLAAAFGAVWLLYVGTTLAGVASAAQYQARFAATDLAAPTRRARSLAVVAWASTIGSIIGPSALATSNRVGLELGMPELAGPWLVNAVMLGLAALVVFVALRPDPYVTARRIREHATGAVEQRPRLRDGIAQLRAHPRAMLGVAVIAAGHVVMVGINTMTPVHLVQIGTPLMVVGVLLSILMGGRYVLAPLVGLVADRAGRESAMWVGIGALLVGVALCGLASGSVVVLGLGLFLVGVGWSFMLISGSAMLVDATDPASRPAVQGVSDVVMNVAGAAGGILAGLIVAFASYGWLAAASTIPLAVLAVLMLRFPRQ